MHSGIYLGMKPMGMAQKGVNTTFIEYMFPLPLQLAGKRSEWLAKGTSWEKQRQLFEAASHPQHWAVARLNVKFTALVRFGTTSQEARQTVCGKRGRQTRTFIALQRIRDEVSSLKGRYRNI